MQQQYGGQPQYGNVGQPQYGGSPVVVGQVVGQPIQGQYAAPPPGVVQGVPYRVDPAQANVGNMPWMNKFSEKRQGNKVEEIRRGGELAQKYPLLPDERPWRDTFWIFPFVLVLLAGIGCCLRYISSDIIQAQFDNVDYPSVGEIVIAGIAGGLASLLMAFLFLQFTKAAPACVVWTSLIFGPCVCIVLGLVLCAVGASNGAFSLVIIGLVFILLGMLSLGCVFFCWRSLIPFMIKLVEVVATVITDNPMMIFVSLLGSTLGVAWGLIMGFSCYGLYREFYEDTVGAQEGKTKQIMGYVLYFLVALVFVWGGLVANNICHVTYCGVFGRWYLQKDEGARLRKSFWNAIGPSFGPICFGSFLIAVIRALEMVVRQMRVDQQGEGNVVCCVILLIVECIIGCIGDFMEYFSEWAYVQVAVRGCSFMNAVRITYSMCSCANIVYVIQDLLLDNVTGMGSLLCAAIGAIVGGGVGYALGSLEKAIAGLIIGLLAGIICGGTAVGVINSGVKTILALWAEAPEALQQTHPDIHGEFDRRIRDKFGQQQ